MIAVMLAGFSALIWGTADFCGGKAVSSDATRRGHAFAVTVVSQLFSIPMIALLLLVVPGQPGVSELRMSVFGWGALAGIAGLFGIVLLYQGLATGAMAVVAPTTAVTAAVVPLLGGLLLGERPGAVALIGAGCAVIAIALVSLTPSRGSGGGTGARALVLALAAGGLFGVFFILLAQPGESAGMWPLVGARIASITLGLFLLRSMRTSLRLTGRVLALTMLAGVLDVAANGLFLMAAYQGNISVVAPVASLYPASTVLLALAVNKERLRAVQVMGLGLAATALVLASM